MYINTLNQENKVIIFLSDNQTKHIGLIKFLNHTLLLLDK